MKISLAKLLGFGLETPRSHFDDKVEKIAPERVDARLAADDGPGVEVDEIGQSFGQFGVRADLYDGRHGIAHGGAETGREEDDIGVGPGEGGGAFGVATRGAEEMEPGDFSNLRVVDDGDDGRVAAFFRCAGRFDCVGDETVADVARAGILGKIAADGPGPGGVGGGQMGETCGDLVANAAIDELLLQIL